MTEIKAAARDIAEYYLSHEQLPKQSPQEFLKALESQDVDFDSIFDLLLPLFEQCSWLEYIYREERAAEDLRTHVQRTQELRAKLQGAQRELSRQVFGLLGDLAPEINRLANMLYYGIGSCDREQLPEWLRGASGPEVGSGQPSPESFDADLHAFLYRVLTFLMQRRLLSSKIATALGGDLCKLFPESQARIIELWWPDAYRQAKSLMATLFAADLAADAGHGELRIRVMHRILENVSQLDTCDIADVLAYLTCRMVLSESEVVFYPDPRQPFVLTPGSTQTARRECTASLRHTLWNEQPFLGCLLRQIVSSSRHEGLVIAAAMSPFWSPMYELDDENTRATAFHEIWSVVPAEWWVWLAYWGDLQGYTDSTIWRSAFQRSLEERKQQLVVLSGMHHLVLSVVDSMAGIPTPHGRTRENTCEVASQTAVAARLCGMQDIVAAAFLSLSDFLKLVDDAIYAPFLATLSQEGKELEQRIPDELRGKASVQVTHNGTESAMGTLISVLGKDLWSDLDQWSQNLLIQGLAQITTLLKSASPRTDFGGPIRSILRSIEREFSLRLADRLFDKFGKRIVGPNKYFRYSGRPTYGEISRFLQQVARMGDESVRDIRQYLLAVARDGQALMRAGTDLEAWTEVWGRAGHGSSDPPDQEDARLLVKAFVDDGLLKRVLSGLRCD